MAATITLKDMRRKQNKHVVVDGIEMKRCGKCGNVVLVSDFYRNCKAWDGLDHCCKACRIEINRSRVRSWHPIPSKPGRKPTYKHIVKEDGTVCKMCSKCMEVKPLTEFGNATWRWDGHYTICVDCRKKYDRERYKSICLARWEAKRGQPKMAATVTP